MAKKEFLRTLSSTSRIVDADLRVSGSFMLPNQVDNEDPSENAIAVNDGKLVLHDGSEWNEISGDVSRIEFDALRDALIPHPTYGMPSAALSANKGITGEIGQTIPDVIFSQVFTQRDGGQVYGYQFRKNGNMFDVGTSITETIVLTGAAVNYQGAVYYYEGPVKNNILGMPDATGKILAGTALTNILQAIGYNASWYGASNAAPSDSAGVRSLQTYNASNQLVSGKQLTNAGNVFTHRTGIINTVHVIVVAPGKSLSSVIDLDSLSKDITDEYVYQGTISVNTAAGVPTAGYKLHVKTMGVAYTSSKRHQITLN